MELVKKNIHRNRTKCEAFTQIAREEDLNISDSRPDAQAVIWNRGETVIDETRITKDHAFVKGRLLFHLLYSTDETNGNLASMEGTIPFEEQVFMDGLETGDTVAVHSVLEDLNVGLINSRKFSVQFLMTLHLVCEVLYDEEASVALEGKETVEYRKKMVETSSTVVNRKDVFRIKEEAELPASYPNIFHLIWSELTPEGVEFHLEDNQIQVQGNIHAFFIYRAENEENEICPYEVTLPFSGTIECSGCKEAMIAEIIWQKGHSEVEIRPDFDGEDRVITFEQSLELSIHVYENEEIELLTDVYGVSEEIETQEKEILLPGCYRKQTDKTKINGGLAGNQPEHKIHKILQESGRVEIEQQEILEEGILVQGTVGVRALYEGEDKEYGTLQGTLPFRYLLQVEKLPDVEVCRTFLQAEAEQLTVTVSGSGEAEARCILVVRAVIWKDQQEKVIEKLTLLEKNMDRRNALPGMAVYVVKNGDSLWDIGKHYYVTIQELMDINHLSDCEVQPGDKILVVKGS